MDSIDRPEPTVPGLPVRITTPRSAVPATAPRRPEAGDAAGSFNVVRMAMRAAARHWWQILALWVIISGGLVCLIAVKLKPSYEVWSLLIVEPRNKDLFNLGLHSTEAFDQYMQTQVQLATSPNVLSAALSNPKVAGLPMLREAEDPEAELKKKLQVSIVPGSYLIRVAMTTPTPGEAAAIINAVVDAYLRSATEWSEQMNRAQIKNLADYQHELQDLAEAKQNEWLTLAAKSNVELNSEPAANGQSSPGLPLPSRSRITIEEYKRVREHLFQVTVELVEAEVMLNMRRTEAAAAPAGEEAASSAQDAARRLKRRVEQAFRDDPEVVQVVQQLEKARRRVDDVKRIARPGSSDPSLVAATKQLQGLQIQYQDLWDRKKGDLQAMLAEEKKVEATDHTLSDLATRVEALKASKQSYEQMLSQLDIANKQEGTDAVKVTIVREDLTSIKAMHEAVGKQLEQLRFEARGDTRARISKINEARPGGLLLGDSRKKLWAVTPVGVLFVVLGLFVMIEAKTGRVGDVDELAQGLPMEIYTVPTLPGPRPDPERPSSRHYEARLQHFLQSLDHLRVSLCEGETGAEPGRCLVVTSAAVGEGKTTLSAQLAVCCAKAGISTLVIDADLRRGTLSRMLHEVEMPGLSEVLKGSLDADEAVVAVADGGFHMVTAGAMGDNPGWLLRGPRLGALLGHYRRKFDLVLIDTPPVLPVPDALTLGRWSDGVVYVVRFDESRLSLVDHARQRIVSSGIPIVKTVVNGVRSSSRHYGGSGLYAYSSSGAPASSAPPEVIPAEVDRQPS